METLSPANPKSAPAPRLRVDLAKRDHATVVRPLCEWLDGSVAAQFRGTLVGLVKAGHRNLVVDLGAVSYVDSSGLGALVSALKMLKTGRERRTRPRTERSRRPAARGDVRLADAQPPVVSLLEIIRMNRVFACYPTVDAAVSSFAKSPS
jgi:anti-sigma B factor antagonist